jgi:RNA polymerase sigma factor (sigma-70 family)
MSEGSGTASFVHRRDHAVFAELYGRYYRSVRNFCRRRVAGDLVDDAVAETFLTAWRRLDDIPAGAGALVWLYGVAYRVIGHQRRSVTRRRRLEDRLRSVVRRAAAPAADEAVVDAVEHRLVVDAAARLGDTDVEVLRLMAWEQLSVADIAAVLEIDPNAAKQRLHRAKTNLGREYRRLETRQLSTPVGAKGGSR